MRSPDSFDSVGFAPREAAPRVDREVVLSAIKQLKGDNEHIDLTDMEKPEVTKVFNLFTEWARSIDQLQGEERMIASLYEYMLMYDAGLVNQESALREIDHKLEDLLEQTKDDNFLELKGMIEEYRKDIVKKLRKIA